MPTVLVNPVNTFIRAAQDDQWDDLDIRSASSFNPHINQDSLLDISSWVGEDSPSMYAFTLKIHDAY